MAAAAGEGEGGTAVRSAQRLRRPNRERAYSVSEGGKFAGTAAANGVAKYERIANIKTII